MSGAADGTSPAGLENDANTANQPNVSVEMLTAVSPQVHAVPPLPSCVLTDPHDDVTLPRLIEALQDRHRIRQTVLQQYSRAADTLMSVLRQVDSALISKEDTIHKQSNKLAEKDAVIQNNKGNIDYLKKKIQVHEEKIGILQKTNKLCEDDKISLQQELQSREQRLRQELSDRRRMERRMHGMMEDTKLKWEKECERRVNAIQVEMQNRLLVKEEKLKQVKAIVKESHTFDSLHLSPRQCQMQYSSSEEVLCEKSPASLSLFCLESYTTTSSEDSGSCPARTYPVPVPIPVPSTSSCLSLASVVSEHQPEVQDSRQALHPTHTPMKARSPARSQPRRSKRRAGCWTPQKDEGKSSVCKTTAEGHLQIPVRPLHRRFRSPGQEKWVDHKPPSNLDVGTVMQPVIPNAIEVSSPSEKTLAKCDKYVLTHQELASDDEIHTHLIKGEIIKTRGGGQAVQFTDIETLKQELVPALSPRKGNIRPH